MAPSQLVSLRSENGERQPWQRTGRRTWQTICEATVAFQPDRGAQCFRRGGILVFSYFSIVAVAGLGWVYSEPLLLLSLDFLQHASVCFALLR